VSSSSSSGSGLCSAEECEGSEIGGEGSADMLSQESSLFWGAALPWYPGAPVSTTIVEEEDPLLDIAVGGVRSDERSDCPWLVVGL